MEVWARQTREPLYIARKFTFNQPGHCFAWAGCRGATSALAPMPGSLDGQGFKARMVLVLLCAQEALLKEDAFYEASSPVLRIIEVA